MTTTIVVMTKKLIMINEQSSDTTLLRRRVWPWLPHPDFQTISQSDIFHPALSIPELCDWVHQMIAHWIFADTDNTKNRITCHAVDGGVTWYR